MKRKSLFILFAAIMFLIMEISVKASEEDLKETPLARTFIEKAVEAGENADFEATYNFYGHTFWEGSLDAKREMKNILKSKRDKEIYNFKDDEKCPTSKGQ